MNLLCQTIHFNMMMPLNNVLYTSFLPSYIVWMPYPHGIVCLLFSFFLFFFQRGCASVSLSLHTGQLVSLQHKAEHQYSWQTWTRIRGDKIERSAKPSLSFHRHHRRDVLRYSSSHERTTLNYYNFANNSRNLFKLSNIVV